MIFGKSVGSASLVCRRSSVRDSYLSGFVETKLVAIEVDDFDFCTRADCSYRVTVLVIILLGWMSRDARARFGHTVGWSNISAGG